MIEAMKQAMVMKRPDFTIEEKREDAMDAYDEGESK